MVTRRKALTWAGLFVLSGLLALLADEYLFPIWFELGWARPVYDFPHRYAEAGAADEWDRLWMRVPFWVAGLLWGGGVGAPCLARSGAVDPRCVTSGLIGWWKPDDVSDGVATDFSGNDLHGLCAPGSTCPTLANDPARGSVFEFVPPDCTADPQYIS